MSTEAASHDQLDLQSIHDFLIELAHAAGRMITSATPTTSDSGTKKNSADLVTETDRAVEAMVQRELKGRFPEFDFMGEETYRPTDRLSTAPTFIIDPIDGTTNFIHGNPYVSISLGFAVDRKPTIGVVYNPFTQHLYSATRGEGAFLTTPDFSSSGGTTKRRLPLRQPPEPFSGLNAALIAVEWGSEREGHDYEVKTRLFHRLAASPSMLPGSGGGGMVHGLRSLGSAALNLCGVAAGFLDAYWETGCYAWDVCAGWVVLEEAGGRVVGAHPGDWRPAVEQRRYFGVRAGQGQEGFVRAFWRCVDGRVEVGFDGVAEE